MKLESSQFQLRHNSYIRLGPYVFHVSIVEGTDDSDEIRKGGERYEENLVEFHSGYKPIGGLQKGAGILIRHTDETDLKTTFMEVRKKIDQEGGNNAIKLNF